jgi:hypothetical protein
MTIEAIYPSRTLRMGFMIAFALSGAGLLPMTAHADPAVARMAAASIAPIQLAGQIQIYQRHGSENR